MKSLTSLSLFLIISVTLFAQNREKAFEINEKLGRGINYGNMFEAPSETAWGNQWQPEYAEIISELGFDHVRIPVRWEPVDRSSNIAPYNIYGSFLNRIKQVVDSALNNGLYAIINMHHHEALYDDPDGQKERFLAMWEQISEFFKNYPDSLLFEILNEPHGNLTAEKWNEFAPGALAKIRESNPERIVLIGTPQYGGLGGLPYLEIPDDDNLILTVHYYNPFQFTHQGAGWVGGNSDDWLGTEWKDTETERDVVRQDFAPLKAIEEKQNIPVHIGEFGAYSKADMTSRAKWTTFLARYFEKQGWSWAYWEFSAGFGIYDPDSKSFRQELVDALLYNEMPGAARYIGTPVYNSDFENSYDGWSLQNAGEASAQMSLANNAIHLDIEKAGTEGWHVQLQKRGFSLSTGKKYRYSFQAKADSARSITSYIGMSSSPWSSYSGYNGATLADTFAVYTFIFDMASTDNNARMVFDLGNSDVNLSVKSISIEEVTFQPPSVAENRKADDIIIYPNPAADFLHIKSAGQYNKVKVVNINGQLLIDNYLYEQKEKIDLSALQPGLYFVIVTGERNSYFTKILKT